MTETRISRGSSCVRAVLGVWVCAGSTVGVAHAQTSPAPGIENAVVARGSASISRAGAETIIRAGDRAIINYSRFDVPAGQSVRFVQPTPASRVLNRVTGPDPSVIAGSLRSNGIVYIANPAGVYFRAGAVVDVGGLYAAAGSITDEDFLRGIDRFTDLRGSVLNDAAIRSEHNVSLIGRHVANTGSVHSSRGLVMMAAGDEVFVGERGSFVLAKFRSSPGKQTGGGSPAGVTNSGSVSAPKGSVTLAGGDMFALAVRNTGTLRARQIAIRGEHGGGVLVSGEIDTSGPGGGDVRITSAGGNVELRGASVNASAAGTGDGGSVYIGGGPRGSGTLPNASSTTVDASSSIRVDAPKGDAGTIVVWSDGDTSFSGMASAAAGSAGLGRGGLIETSGKDSLSTVGARVVAPGSSSDPALNGTWLLDPKNIRIDTAGSGGSEFEQVVAPATIDAALDSGTNVTLTTSDATHNSTGNIYQAPGALIQKSSGGEVTLTFRAASDIVLDGGILSTAGPLNVRFTANDAAQAFQDANTAAGDVRINAPVSTNGGRIDSGGVRFTNTAPISAGAGNVSILHSGQITIGGSISAARFTGSTLGLIDTSAPITSGQTLVLSSLGPITIGGSLAAPQSIAIRSGASGVGDLLFAVPGLSLASDSISLRAGRGSGSGTSVVDATTNSPVFEGAAGPGSSPALFSIRNDATLREDLVPGDAQFSGGIAGINYSLRSDLGSITINGGVKVDGTHLFVKARDGITLIGPIDLASLEADSATRVEGFLRAAGDLAFNVAVTAEPGAHLASGTGAVRFFNSLAALGDLTVEANEIDLGLNASTPGMLTLMPADPAVHVRLNGSIETADLDLTQAEIARLRDQVTSLRIGRTDGDADLSVSGIMTLGSATELLAGRDIVIGAGDAARVINGPLTLAADRVLLGGEIATGGSAASKIRVLAPVTLTADASASTTLSGPGADVFFAGPVDALTAGAAGLNVRAGAADVDLLQGLGVSSPLSFADIAGGSVWLSSARTTGAQTYAALGSIDASGLLDASTINASAATITLADATTAGAQSYAASAGLTASGPLSAASVIASAATIDLGAVSTTGAQTYLIDGSMVVAGPLKAASIDAVAASIDLVSASTLGTQAYTTSAGFTAAALLEAGSLSVTSGTINLADTKTVGTQVLRATTTLSASGLIEGGSLDASGASIDVRRAHTSGAQTYAASDLVLLRQDFSASSLTASGETLNLGSLSITNDTSLAATDGLLVRGSFESGTLDADAGSIDVQSVTTTGSQRYVADSAFVAHGPLSASSIDAAAGAIAITSAASAGAQSYRSVGAFHASGAITGGEVRIDAGSIELASVLTSSMQSYGADGAMSVSGLLEGSSISASAGSISLVGAATLGAQQYFSSGALVSSGAILAESVVAEAGSISITGATTSAAQAFEADGAFSASDPLNAAQLTVRAASIDLMGATTSGSQSFSSTALARARGDLIAASLSMEVGSLDAQGLRATGEMSISALGSVIVRGDISADSLSASARSIDVRSTATTGAQDYNAAAAMVARGDLTASRVSIDAGSIEVGAVTTAGAQTYSADATFRARGDMSASSVNTSAASISVQRVLTSGEQTYTASGVFAAEGEIEAASISVDAGSITAISADTAGAQRLVAQTSIAISGPASGESLSARGSDIALDQLTFSGLVEVLATGSLEIAGPVKAGSLSASAFDLALGTATLPGSATLAAGRSIALNGAFEAANLTASAPLIDIQEVNTSGTQSYAAGTAAGQGLTIHADLSAAEFSFSGRILFDGVRTIVASQAIDFAGPIDSGLNGPAVLTIEGHSARFGAPVGGLSPLASIRTPESMLVRLAAGEINVTSDLVFNGPVVLESDHTIASASGDIRIAALDGPHDLLLASGGGISLGPIGASVPIGDGVGHALSIVDADTTVFAGRSRFASGILVDSSLALSADIDVLAGDSASAFSGLVTLPADRTITAQTDSVFFGGIEGPGAITFAGPGAVRVRSVVGGVTPLARFGAGSGQLVELAGEINATGGVLLTGPVEVSADSSLTSDSDAIVILGSIDSGPSAPAVLRLRSSRNLLVGPVGAGAPLATLAVTGPAEVFSGIVRTSGDMTFSDSVLLAADVDLFASSGSISIVGDLHGPHDAALSAPAGTITFGVIGGGRGGGGGSRWAMASARRSVSARRQARTSSPSPASRRDLPPIRRSSFARRSPCLPETRLRPSQHRSPSPSMWPSNLFRVCDSSRSSTDPAR